MVNTLIFAGGVGSRLGSELPKQFLEVDGKPIIVHTLEHFSHHEQVDGIVVVCKEDYISLCRQILEKYHISKVYDVIPGGATGQLSIYEGLRFLMRFHGESAKDVTVLIHDGVRPLIDADLISRSIEAVRLHGSSIAASPAIETIVQIDEKGDLKQIVDRSLCRYAKAPQCFMLPEIYGVHEKALEKGETEYIDSATLMAAYGKQLHTTPCSSENIKITTPNDFFSFEALYRARQGGTA